MKSADVYSLQRSDLNAFLFADVGVEANGTMLTVLSTLARLGVDPWQEAARLAKLPRMAAIDGLARIIAAMPASLWPLQDATAIAARLVALLPAGGGASPAQLAPVPARTSKRWTVVLLVLAAVLAGMSLDAFWERSATSDSTVDANWSAGR
jgi:hypothetical protein